MSSGRSVALPIVPSVWLELAKELGLTTSAPATPEDIASAEEAVGCPLPAELRGLLEETDGLLGEYSLELVYTAQEIARVNREMRTFAGFDELYMPFDPLLFFGAEGNGDLYGFRILGGQADELWIFVWDHETDSRTATTHGLWRYLDGDRWHRNG